ncbi:MAG: hypothetical protein NT133_15460 [Alphaproteobacteria bacterium]|nr:hypothetical protein [Alphaproteobacteria bacterium]
MTRGAVLNDRMHRAMGRAASVSGVWCDAYRPHGAGPALDPANRFLRLPAYFAPHHSVWHGIFDAAYTQVGDYIVQDDAVIWFVAAQDPLQPLICIRTNRLADISRPAGATRPGVNDYGGVAKETSAPLLTQWPASILAGGGSGAASAGLPADVPGGSWQIMLPSLAGVVLRSGDIVRDDLGRTAVVSSAELSATGWRLVARQAAA